MKVLKVTQSWHIDYIRANLLRKKPHEEHIQAISDGLGEILPITPLDNEGRLVLIHEGELVRRVLVTYDVSMQEKLLEFYPETEIVER